MSVDVDPVFIELSKPFQPDEVKERIVQGSRKAQYVTARTVMNRLDDVVGPANWSDDYVPLEHSVICRLTIQLPDGRTVTKCDAGAYAGMPDEGDDDKSGFSDAFKRAAVKFGIGRYLYRDGVPRFANTETKPKAKPAAAALTTETESPGERLAKWAAREGIVEWVGQVGDDLGFPKNMNAWNQAQCDKMTAEYHKAKRAQRAQAASVN